MTDEDAVHAAHKMTEVVEGLRGDMRELREAWTAEKKSAEDERRTSHRWRWVTGVLAVLIIGLAYLAVTNRTTAHRVAEQTASSKARALCVSDWANAYAERTNALTPAANARTDALDALIRTLPAAATESPAQQKALFDARLLAYLKASDAYQDAAAKNPPPLAPQFTC